MRMYEPRSEQIVRRWARRTSRVGRFARIIVITGQSGKCDMESRDDPHPRLNDGRDQALPDANRAVPDFHYQNYLRSNKIWWQSVVLSFSAE